VVRAAVLAHGKTLARKRAQTLRRDDYGILIDDDWLKQVDYFLDRVVRPRIDSDLAPIFNEMRGELRQKIIEPMLDQMSTEFDSPIVFDPDSHSPAAYEAYCAKVLRQAGWNAQTTRATRDQGVDIIAEKDGVRVVLQCKKYSQPVGNKAVQEVYAAMRFERAHRSCRGVGRKADGDISCSRCS
jgi:restriction system protein